MTTYSVMEMLSSAIRGTIISSPGNKLVVADLANIEGRVQAWLANEEWKLQAFRNFDAGIGPDLYKLAYSKSFGVRPEDVTKDQRQVGKVQELALAYAGGVGAFVTFAGAYGIDLDAMAAKVLPLAPELVVEEADRFFEWTLREKRSLFNLSDDAFVACDTLKRVWRYAHPNITDYWKRLQTLVKQALGTRGIEYVDLGLRVKVTKTWLLITLPSGRVACYPAPQIKDNAITYMGIDQFTRKWSRIYTHGGKLYENIIQGISRDVLAHSMPHIEAAGYKIVLTVHDEIIAEAPDSIEFNAEHLSALMSTPPAWAADMPLAAEGFETYRYRKQ